ncbi:hypothetical protein IWQ61_003607 [Dispira simplex]|nr:hypothetical protein IWQ61_003607 [Dispira simplex]
MTMSQYSVKTPVGSVRKVPSVAERIALFNSVTSSPPGEVPEPSKPVSTNTQVAKSSTRRSPPMSNTTRITPPTRLPRAATPTTTKPLTSLRSVARTPSLRELTAKAPLARSPRKTKGSKPEPRPQSRSFSNGTTAPAGTKFSTRRTALKPDESHSHLSTSQPPSLILSSPSRRAPPPPPSTSTRAGPAPSKIPRCPSAAHSRNSPPHSPTKILRSGRPRTPLSFRSSPSVNNRPGTPIPLDQRPSTPTPPFSMTGLVTQLPTGEMPPVPQLPVFAKGRVRSPTQAQSTGSIVNEEAGCPLGAEADTPLSEMDNPFLTAQEKRLSGIATNGINAELVSTSADSSTMSSPSVTSSNVFSAGVTNQDVETDSTDHVAKAQKTTTASAINLSASSSLDHSLPSVATSDIAPVKAPPTALPPLASLPSPLSPSTDTLSIKTKRLSHIFPNNSTTDSKPSRTSLLVPSPTVSCRTESSQRMSTASLLGIAEEPTVRGGPASNDIGESPSNFSVSSKGTAGFSKGKNSLPVTAPNLSENGIDKSQSSGSTILEGDPVSTQLQPKDAGPTFPAIPSARTKVVRRSRSHAELNKAYQSSGVQDLLGDHPLPTLVATRLTGASDLLLHRKSSLSERSERSMFTVSTRSSGLTTENFGDSEELGILSVSSYRKPSTELPTITRVIYPQQSTCNSNGFGTSVTQITSPIVITRHVPIPTHVEGDHDQNPPVDDTPVYHYSEDVTCRAIFRYFQSLHQNRLPKANKPLPPVPPEDSSVPDLHSLSLGNKDGTNGPSSTLARLLPRSRRKASNSTSTETLGSSPPLTPPSLPSLPPLPSIRPMSILSKADDTRYSILSESSEFASGQSIGGASCTTSGSRLKKRRHVEMELADTEQAYLQDLYVLYEVFYKPCAQRPDLFSPRVMQLLFGNLGQVVACATYLTVLFNMALQEILGQRKRVSECSTVTSRTLAWGDSMEFTPLSPRVAPIREEEKEKMAEPGTSTSAPMSRSPSTVGLSTRITVLPMTQRNVSNPLPPGGRPLQSNLGGRPALGTAMGIHGFRSTASVHNYGGVASPPSGPSSVTDVGNSAIAVPISPPPIPPVPTHSHTQASMGTQHYSQSAADIPNSTAHSMDINKNGGDAVGHRTSVASTMMSLVRPGEVAAEKSQELAVPVSSTGTKQPILPCPSLVVVHDLLDGLLQEAPHLRVHVADSFRAMAQQVREIYSLYCSNFDTAMLTLNLLQKEDPAAKAFLESQQRLLNGKTHAWDLASLLIKPVQRVLKYPLLFQQLMKLSDEGTRDHEAFMGAYKKAEGIAEHINHVKRRMALVHRMIETNGSIIPFPVRHSNTLAVRKLAQHCSPRKLSISSRILPGYLATHDAILSHHSHGKHPAKSHQGVRSTPSSPKTGTFEVPSGAPVETRSRRHKLNHSKSHTNLKAMSSAGTVSGSSGLREFSQTLRLGLAKTLGRSKAPQLDLTAFADQRLDPYQPEAPSAVVPSPLPSVVDLDSNDSLHPGENSLVDLPGTADENTPGIVVSEGAPHPRTPNLPTVLGFGPPSRQDKTSSRNITAVSNGSGRSTTSFIKLLQRFETQLVTAHVFRKQVELWLNGVSQWGTDCCQMGRDCRQFMVLDSVKTDRDKRRAREKPPEAKVISHPMDAMGPHWERRGSVSTTIGGPYATGYDANARQGESNAGMVSRRMNRNGSVSICPTAEPSPSGSIISLNSALVSPSQESTLTQVTLSPGRRLPSAGMRSPQTTQIGEGTREGRSASFHEVPLAEVTRRTSVSKRQPPAALLPAMQSALSKELGSSMAADGMIQMVQLNQHTRELESVIVPSIRSAVDTHIYPHLQCLVGLFHNPSVIIRKHADRAVDYVRYTTLKQQGDTPLPTEKGLVEAAEEYELLGAQLAQELPVFLRHTTQLFVIVVDKFQAIQRDFYHQCALSLRSCCQSLVKKPGEVGHGNSVTLHQIIQDYRVALNVPSHPNRFAHTPGLKSPHESAGLGQDSGLLSPLGPIPPELRETTSALDLTQWKDDTSSFNMIPIYPSSSATHSGTQHPMPEPSATVALSLSERLDRMVDNIKWSVHKTRDPSRRRSPSLGQQPGSANRTPDLSTYSYPNPLEQDDYFTAVHPVRVKTSKSHLSRESSLSRRRAVLIDYGSESGVPENAAMLFRPVGRIDSRNGSLLDDSATSGVQHREPTSAAAAELEIALGIRPAHAGRDQPGGHGDNPFLTPDEYPSDSGYLTDTFNDPLFNGVGSPALTQQGAMPQYFFESFSSLNTVTDEARQRTLTLSNDPTPLVSRQNSQRSALGLSVSNYKLPNLTLTRSDSWGLRGSLATTYRQGPTEDPSTNSSHPIAPNGGNPFTDDHACSSTGSSNDTSPVLPFKTLGANPVQFNGVAIYPYAAQSPHELSLAHGDHIEVSWVAKVALDQSVEAQPVSQPQGGDVLATEWWWYGKFCQRTGQKGWFPARYAFRQV